MTSASSRTLDQFREELAPCFAARATITRLETELLAARNQRADSDRTARKILQQVVHSVISDIRKSERKSGLSRKAKAAATKQ